MRSYFKYMGNLKNIKSDTLIAKYLSLNTNDTESKQLEKLLLDDSEFSQDFELSQKIWNQSADIQDIEVPVFDGNISWNRFAEKNQLGYSRKKTFNPIFKNYWIRVAAFVLLLMGLTVYITRVYMVSSISVETVNQFQTITLPDQSVVDLYPGSKLSYQKSFKNGRIININGDAYLKIQPDKLKPFRVYTNTGIVEVLGTEFLVTQDITGCLSVSVSSGIVQLQSIHNDQLKVKVYKGEQAKLTPHSSEIKIEPILNNNIFAWKTKKIYFNNTPLSEVLETVNKAYHSNISIAGNGWDSLKLNARFEGQNLEQICNILEITFKIDIIDHRNMTQKIK